MHEPGLGSQLSCIAKCMTVDFCQHWARAMLDLQQEGETGMFLSAASFDSALGSAAC